MLSADDVTRMTFTSGVLREGYDMEQVDGFLDRVVEVLRHRESGARDVSGLLTGTEVLGSVFTSVRFRPGYDVREVDVFLDQIARQLGEGAPAPSRSRPLSGRPQAGPPAEPLAATTGVSQTRVSMGARLLRLLRGEQGR